MNSVNSEKQYRIMLKTPIPRLVTALALPSTISTLITVIYNTADTYFVSQINESASAAVGVVYSIMAILQAVGFGIAMGTSSLVSRQLGKKQDKQACVVASSALFAAIVAGLLVGVLGLSMLRPILRLIGCSETMLPYAVPYARIILMGAPISCSTFVISNILRAEGDSRMAMWGNATGGILNIGLDAFLIFYCKMGSAGAALATVISQSVCWGIMFSSFLRGKTIIKLKPGYISRNLRTYGEIFSTGSPTVLRQGLGSIAATALNVQAVVYGDAAVAAMTIANKVYTLVRQTLMGLGQGFQPVAGYNFGAGQRKRAYSAFLFATVVGSVFCLLATAFSATFALEIMLWFNDSAKVAEIGVRALRLSCCVMPFLAFSTFVNMLYQCLGFAKIASGLAACRQGIFFLPLILVLPRVIGLFGVQVSQPLADLITFFVSIPFAIRFYRREVKAYL